MFKRRDHDWEYWYSGKLRRMVMRRRVNGVDEIRELTEEEQREYAWEAMDWG